MQDRVSARPNRRRFMKSAGTVSAVAAASAVTMPAAEPAVAADGAARAVPAAHSARPPVTEPRATSGDVSVEPDWQERLTIVVGPKSGDILGTSEKAIQSAVDWVHRFGGGTVRLLEGTYRLRNSVTLTSGVRLIGSGPDTVLIKEPAVTTKIAADSDWYDQEITVADPKGLRVGDGVCLRCKDPHHGGATVLKRTLVARSGNRFKLDRPLRENLWLMSDVSVSTLFPLVTGEFVHHLWIENLVIDGNKANNPNLDGNYAGCIFLQDCRDVTIRRVTARNNNGDGISWQICHDVVVEECASHDHAGLGLHPGSGSQRPIMRKNILRNNEIGLFFCWGVKYGLAADNLIEDNRGSGVSVGHRDTDNLIEGNTIRQSGRVGILFRPERGKAFAGHRNTIKGNRVENTGGPEGIAVDVQGETEGLTFIGNTLTESRGPAKRIGMRFGAKNGEMTLTDNQIRGFATDIQDLRPKPR